MPYNYLTDTNSRRTLVCGSALLFLRVCSKPVVGCGCCVLVCRPTQHGHGLLQKDLWPNSIIIFDEAHNLGGICAEAASFDLSAKDVAMSINEVSLTRPLTVECNAAGLPQCKTCPCPPSEGLACVTHGRGVASAGAALALADGDRQRMGGQRSMQQGGGLPAQSHPRRVGKGNRRTGAQGESSRVDARRGLYRPGWANPTDMSPFHSSLSENSTNPTSKNQTSRLPSINYPYSQTAGPALGS